MYRTSDTDQYTNLPSSHSEALLASFFFEETGGYSPYWLDILKSNQRNKTSKLRCFVFPKWWSIILMTEDVVLTRSAHVLIRASVLLLHNLTNTPSYIHWWWSLSGRLLTNCIAARVSDIVQMMECKFLFFSFPFLKTCESVAYIRRSIQLSVYVCLSYFVWRSTNYSVWTLLSHRTMGAEIGAKVPTSWAKLDRYIGKSQISKRGKDQLLGHQE
jgi:hypothetical protein